jgi:hypothetical protein
LLLVRELRRVFMALFAQTLPRATYPSDQDVLRYLVKAFGSARDDGKSDEGVNV